MQRVQSFMKKRWKIGNPPQSGKLAPLLTSLSFTLPESDAFPLPFIQLPEI